MTKAIIGGNCVPVITMMNLKNPRIMLPDISIRGNFTLDDKGEFYCVNTAYIISSQDKYLLGIVIFDYVYIQKYFIILSRWIFPVYLSIPCRTSHPHYQFFQSERKETT